MKTPILEKDKCSILIAEYSTGHIFKKDLTLFLNGDNEIDVFQIFDNLKTAKEFVLNFIEGKSEFECAIFNHNGEHIATFDLTGERKYQING